MAGNYILLVTNKERGFVANTLTQALQNADIEVRSVSISDGNLHTYIECAFGVLVANSFENAVIMNAIKQKCYDTNKKVILYGDPGELEAMKRIFVKSIIYEEFTRPVEMEAVVASVRKLKIKADNQDVMKKILVVDDNGVFLRTVTGWLSGKYIVALANSASSAVTAIQKSVPDLILLDYEMPICSGAQFMEILSRTEGAKDIPIIFLTSRSDAQTVKEVMALKPKGYILKTTPQEELLQKIEDFFDSVNEQRTLIENF